MATRVLVTGAGGFIGSHLTEELVKRGCSVRAMVHYNAQNNWGWLETIPKNISDSVEVFPADIRDPFIVRKSVSGCDTVYHLAALIPIPYSYVAPVSYVQTNAMGTLNLLQACLEEGTERVVHTSTSEVYGTAQYVPIDEKHPIVGQSPYSATKIAGDKLAEAYYHSFGLSVSTIRPFNTFGPRQSARAVIPTIISQALSGAKAISLGSLAPVRDLTYVEDMVRGFIEMGNSDDAVGKITNFGQGDGISVGELARLILDLCNSSADIVFDVKRERPKKSEVLQLICDNRRAEERFGWQPKYSLRTGLEKTINWIGSNLEYYKWRIYNV